MASSPGLAGHDLRPDGIRAFRDNRVDFIRPGLGGQGWGMLPCCGGMNVLMANVGKHGISVSHEVEDGRCRFKLHARSVDEAEEFKLARIPRMDDPPRPFLIQATQGIQFCPYCGSNLRDALGTGGGSRDDCGSTSDHLSGRAVATAFRELALVGVLALTLLAFLSWCLGS